MPTRLTLPANGRRVIYDLSPFGLPEVPYLAAQNLPFADLSFPMHLHKGRMEINYFLKGERVYLVGGEEFHLRGNHIFITWPGEVHGNGSALTGRGVHFWMQVALPRPGSSFLGFKPKWAQPLLEALWTMPRRHFRAEAGMRELYTQMLLICREERTPLADTQLSTLLADWFLLLVKGSSQEWREEITPDIARALKHMRSLPYGRLSIGELAETACLSEPRFKGKFREQLGVPPGEYLLRLRSERGAELLLDGRNGIADIANELGFSSSQHFSSTFKKFFGASPQTWVRAMKSKALSVDDGGRKEDFQADNLRLWVDDSGRAHGHVSKSYSGGNHPN